MASASSKKSLDTDYITFRKVFAKLSDNSQVPANYVVASYGDGQTYWAQPSTLGMLPTFTAAKLDESLYIATPTTRFLQLNDGDQLQLSTILVDGKSTLQINAHVYQFIDISGSDLLYAFSNFRLTNNLKFTPTGFLSAGTVALNNTLVFKTLREAPALSTNVDSFQTLKVVSSVQSPTDLTTASGNVVISSINPSIVPVLSGFNDFQFTTNFQPTNVFLELSSYSATSFLGLSSIVGAAFISSFSTISSLYTQKDIFSTALISLSTTESLITSTNLSIAFGVSNYARITYNQKFGETMARATITQLNAQFELVNTGLSSVSTYKTPVYVLASTNQGFVNSLSTPQFISTTVFPDFNQGSIFNFTVNGIIAVSTQLSTLSTAVGFSIQDYTIFTGTQINSFPVSTASTFINLGVIGYVSSPSLPSTLHGLGTFQYISTASLVSTFSNLQLEFPNRTILNSSFASTTAGLFARQLIISSLTLQSSLISTVSGFPVELVDQYTTRTSLQADIVSTTQGIRNYGGNEGYISTLTLTSTIISSFSTNLLYPGLPYTLSTVLSTLSAIKNTTETFFLSTASLTSTIIGLPNINYITRENLVSTTDSLLNIKRTFISSLTLPNFPTVNPVNVSTAFDGLTGTAYIPTGGFDPYSGFPFTDAFPYTAKNQYFSSIQFQSLGGFSDKITNSQYVIIEYTPNLNFLRNNNNFAFYMGGSNQISTLIQIGDTVYHDTLFIEKFQVNQRGTGTNIVFSTFYTKKILMQMKKDDFLKAENNGFAIVHVNQNMSLYNNYTNTTYFYLQENCLITTQKNNSLFISIYN